MEWDGLFSLALYRPGDKLDEFSDLAKYISRVKPALYSKWLGFPGGITKTMLERMNALKGFRFKKHKYCLFTTMRKQESLKTPAKCNLA